MPTFTATYANGEKAIFEARDEETAAVLARDKGDGAFKLKDNKKSAPKKSVKKATPKKGK